MTAASDGYLHETNISSALCGSLPSKLAGRPSSPFWVVMGNCVLKKETKESSKWSKHILGECTVFFWLDRRQN